MQWGDLSPEQRAALPVGTVLVPSWRWPGDPLLTKCDDGLWYASDDRCTSGWSGASGLDPSRFVAYCLPDPRDSAGATADEGGGPEVGGDCDHDGDVSEVAEPPIGEPVAWIYDGGPLESPRWRAPKPHEKRLRATWPPTCDSGGDDPPRDCLEEDPVGHE